MFRVLLLSPCLCRNLSQHYATRDIFTLAGLLLTLINTSGVRADTAADPPDFKEVYDLIRNAPGRRQPAAAGPRGCPSFGNGTLPEGDAFQRGCTDECRFDHTAYHQSNFV